MKREKSNRLAGLASALTQSVPIFFIALSVRLVYLVLIFDEKMLLRWLPKSFDGIAMDILHGQSHIYPTSWASLPVFLAGLYYLLDLCGMLSSRVLIVALANAVLGALSCALFTVLLRKLFPGKLFLCLTASLLWLFYYPGIYFNSLILSENLFTPLVLGLLCIAVVPEKVSFRWVLASGTIFAFALVIRPIIAPFLPLYLLWLWQFKKYSIRDLAVHYVLPFAVAASVVVSVVSFVNQRTHSYGKFSFADNGGVNFAIAWCQPRVIRYRALNGESRWFSSPDYWHRNPATDILTDKPFFQQMHYFKIGLGCIEENPGRIWSKFGSLAKVFWGRFYPDLLPFSAHRFLLVFWKIVIAPFIFGFILYPFVYRERRSEWWLGAYLLISLLASVYATNPGEERYLAPYAFLFFAWGVAALSLSLQSLARRSLGMWSEHTYPFFSLLLWLLVAVLLTFLLLPQQQFLTPPKSFAQKDWELPSLSHKQAINTFRLAAEWLVNNQREDGSFIYRISTKTSQTLPGNSGTRQLLSSQGLAVAASYFDDSRMMQAHKHNLTYVQSLLHYEDRFIYVRAEGTWLPINESAFAAMTLIDSPFAKDYKKEIDGIGEFLLSQQKPSGRFLMWYPLLENEGRTKREEFLRQRFASGEAALACVYLYRFTGDVRYLRCAEKAFAYYSPRIINKFHPSFGSWHTIAYAQLYEIDPKEKYLDAIRFMAGELKALQNPPLGGLPKLIPGGFDRDSRWFSSAEAVYTEALGFASRVFYNRDRTLAEEMRKANGLAMYNLRYLQLRHYTNPRLRGGIQTDKKVHEIQTDNVGHALMAFYEYATRNKNFR